MPSAIAPVPTVTETVGGGACGTSSQNKGICCAALTQLGAARAAQGFSYVNCKGKTVCMACGIRPSTSKNPAKAGQPVFIPRRVTCGPSGCPALAQASPITPV
jgi:hypothetical protein